MVAPLSLVDAAAIGGGESRMDLGRDREGSGWMPYAACHRRSSPPGMATRGAMAPR